jgi:hypothetical protein
MHSARINAARIPLAAFTMIMFLLLFVPSSHAKHRAEVGVGDNSPAMFVDGNFRSLNTTIARKIIPWDFYESPEELASLNSWITNASTLGIEPLIAFEHSHVSLKELPSITDFAKSVKYLRTNFPGVTSISPWNEANHVSQPTINNPKRAAQYFKVVLKQCPRCRIVAADVLDQTNMIPWLTKFKRYAGGRARIWGLHSYADTNKNRHWGTSATKKLLRTVKGKIWLTEVGGIVAFKYNFIYDEARAATAVQKTLDLGTKSNRIERVYLYSWFGVDQSTTIPPFKWDSGIVGPTGAARPSFEILRNWMSTNAS